jgi:hypothetical protein
VWTSDGLEDEIAQLDTCSLSRQRPMVAWYCTYKISINTTDVYIIRPRDETRLTKVAGSSRVYFPPVKELRLPYLDNLTHACVLTCSFVVDTSNDLMARIEVCHQTDGRTLCVLRFKAKY